MCLNKYIKFVVVHYFLQCKKLMTIGFTVQTQQLCPLEGFTVDVVQNVNVTLFVNKHCSVQSVIIL